MEHGKRLRQGAYGGLVGGNHGGLTQRRRTDKIGVHFAVKQQAR